MKTTALIETWPDGVFYIVLMDLKHHTIFGNGATIKEAKEDLQNSYKEILDYYADEGKPVPEELRDLEFEYKYAIASFFEEFKWINISALAKAIGMNPSLLYQYKKG